MKHEALDHLTQVFRSLAPALPGSQLAWMDVLRLRAFEQFRVMGFPTRADEAWKYTSLDALNQRLLRFVPASDHLAEARRIARAQQLDGVHRLVFVDGVFAPELSDIGTLPSGVFVGSLAEALDTMPERVRAHLDGVAFADGLTALNNAFARDGYVVFVPPGVTVDKPVHALFVAGEEGLAVQPLNLLVAANDAHCTVIEQFTGSDEAWYYTNAMTHVAADERADVRHYRLQQEGPHALHTATLAATQQRNSRFASYAFSFGAALARATIATRLAGPQTSTTLDGLYVGSGKQHLDHYTMIDHAQPQCTSRETYRGILDGAAHGVFNGRVIVRQDAQKTDADQANHNLLLSRNAEIDTKPQLEIFADDVRCTHGTTVGQLDEQQLFYLRARGIDERTARALLTTAFARDVIDRVEIAPLRARLEAALLAKMAGATDTGSTQ